MLNVIREHIILIWGWFIRKKCLTKIEEYTMTEKNGKKESAQIIQGPWKKREQKNHEYFPTLILDEVAIEIEEAMRFSDVLAEECLLQMIQTFIENKIDVSEKSFIRDCGYLIEVIKAIIYRDNDLYHPIQRMIELCTDLTIDPDNSVHSELNMDKVIDIIEEEDGRPEIS